MPEGLSKKLKKYLYELIKVCDKCAESPGLGAVEKELNNLSYFDIKFKEELKLKRICNNCEGRNPDVADYIRTEYNNHLLK